MLVDRRIDDTSFFFIFGQIEHSMYFRTFFFTCFLLLLLPLQKKKKNKLKLSLYIEEKKRNQNENRTRTRTTRAFIRCL